MSNNLNQGASIEAAIRAEFESEVRNLDLPADALARWPDGRYLQEPIESMWSGWQMARRTPAATTGDGELPPLPVYFYDITGALRMKGRGFEFEYGPVGEYVRLQDVTAAIAADRAQRQAAPASAQPADLNSPEIPDGSKTGAQPDQRESAAVPDGWKLVPVEPTQEMFNAARTSASGSSTEKTLMASYWRNMLAASPAAQPAEDEQNAPKCWCHTCNKDRTIGGWPYAMTTMILCPTCGNKRCPKATNHALACTNSNEPGQLGSVYGDSANNSADEQKGGA